MILNKPVALSQVAMNAFLFSKNAQVAHSLISKRKKIKTPKQYVNATFARIRNTNFENSFLKLEAVFKILKTNPSIL